MSLPRPVTLAANGQYEFSLYLTNYFDFTGIGAVSFEWKIVIPTVKNDALIPVQSTGAFSVAIHADELGALDAELSRYLNIAQNEKDHAVRQAMIEGICSIHDPKVLPFLQRLLAVPDGEGRSIETLCQEWINNPECTQILGNYIETSSNTRGITDVIAKLLENRRFLSNKQLSRLLHSPDVSIRYCGLCYIHELLSSMHLDDLPKNGPEYNIGIGNEYENIFKILTDVLEQKNKISPKQQGDKKEGAANGF